MKKLHSEFNKTDFGMRAKYFSILPVIAIIFTVIEWIVSEWDVLCACFVFLNLSLFGITQLLYGNMLKEFIQTKDKK